MTKSFIFPRINGYIKTSDLDNPELKAVVDDMHDFMRVSKRKKASFERCRDNSIIEQAVFESYKHWDNPWSILNADLSRGMRILDCGSGRGILQFYLADKGMDVYSVDISDNSSRLIKKLRGIPGFLHIRSLNRPDRVHKKLNRRYNVDVKFRLESAEKLSFPDGYFDRIFCISVIEHMDDIVIGKAIKEMERVLKKGGLLLLTFDFHPVKNKNIIGFTEEEFKKKVMDKCGLRYANNKPDFKIMDWNSYLLEINGIFGVNNPNTSFGVALKK